MPSNSERRLINWFAYSVYNSCNEPRIVEINAGPKQEAPDAICKTEDGKIIALELTSFGSPKRTYFRHKPICSSDLKPLTNTLDRKLNNDYSVPGADEVWLVAHLRYTLTPSIVEEAVGDLLLPPRFNRIYLEWPLPRKTEDRTSIVVLELVTHKLWIPELPCPKGKKQKIPQGVSVGF